MDRTLSINGGDHSIIGTGENHVNAYSAPGLPVAFYEVFIDRLLEKPAPTIMHVRFGNSAEIVYDGTAYGVVYLCAVQNNSPLNLQQGLKTARMFRQRVKARFPNSFVNAADENMQMAIDCCQVAYHLSAEGDKHHDAFLVHAMNYFSVVMGWEVEAVMQFNLLRLLHHPVYDGSSAKLVEDALRGIYSNPFFDVVDDVRKAFGYILACAFP